MSTSANQSLLGNDLRLKEILVFVFDGCGQIQPSGQLNPDDTKDGGVTDITWSNSPEILIVCNLRLRLDIMWSSCAVFITLDPGKPVMPCGLRYRLLSITLEHFNRKTYFPRTAGF